MIKAGSACADPENSVRGSPGCCFFLILSTFFIESRTDLHRDAIEPEGVKRLLERGDGSGVWGGGGVSTSRTRFSLNKPIGNCDIPGWSGPNVPSRSSHVQNMDKTVTCTSCTYTRTSNCKKKLDIICTYNNTYM